MPRASGDFRDPVALWGFLAALLAALVLTALPAAAVSLARRADHMPTAATV